MRSISTMLLLFALGAGCNSTPKATHPPLSLMPTQGIQGWKPIKGGHWMLKDGILHGTKEASIQHHCLLVSEKKFSNFTAKIEYKCVRDNSGFYIRLQEADNGVGFAGYHIEIDSKGNNEGGIFDVAVAWIVKPDPTLIQEAFKPGDWNTMTIEAIGPNIRVVLNGVEMCAIKGKRTLSGRFGIQLHANENTHVQFRKIDVIEHQKSR